MINHGKAAAATQQQQRPKYQPKQQYCSCATKSHSAISIHPNKTTEENTNRVIKVGNEESRWEGQEGTKRSKQNRQLAKVQSLFPLGDGGAPPSAALYNKPPPPRRPLK